jgi:hypothetical protein
MDINFRIFNKEGIIILVKKEKGILPKPITFESEMSKFLYNPSKKGIMWIYNDKEVVIEDDNCDVVGGISANLKYVIATYSKKIGKGVISIKTIIYNLDGSIHKILRIPPLKSPLAIERLEFLKEENPPLKYIDFFKGLELSNSVWHKLENGDVVDTVSIIFDQELYETRALNAETGEIGDLIHYGKN